MAETYSTLTFLTPNRRLEDKVDEAGPRDVDLGNFFVGTQFLGDIFRELPRLLARVFCEHHRCVGRHISMAGIAWWFDHDAREVSSRSEN